MVKFVFFAFLSFKNYVLSVPGSLPENEVPSAAVRQSLYAEKSQRFHGFDCVLHQSRLPFDQGGFSEIMNTFGLSDFSIPSAIFLKHTRIF